MSKKDDKKPNHSTTRYLRNRTNPLNPTDHETKTGEYYDFRKLVEAAAREEIDQQSPGSGYQLAEGRDKITKEPKITLSGKSSKILEQFEEQWLFSKGYLDENGHVSMDKYQELLRKDEAKKQELIDAKRSHLKAKKPLRMSA